MEVFPELVDVSATLRKRLEQKLLTEPGCRLPEQDFQDFEFGYCVSAEASALRLQVRYPFLGDVLAAGSQQLLDGVWNGLPLSLTLEAEAISVAVDCEALVDESVRQRCLERLAAARLLLLCGPLVKILAGLRSRAGAAGSGPAAAPVGLRFRDRENCWILAKPDRVVVYFSVHLEHEVEVALGRSLCVEFAEAFRGTSGGAATALPCTFTDAKDPPPTDIRTEVAAAGVAPNVGYLALTISDERVRGASDDRLLALSAPVMTLRNFLDRQLKSLKSYIHTRMRANLDKWQLTLNRAHRVRKEERRRTIKGKEFQPGARRSQAAMPVDG